MARKRAMLRSGSRRAAIFDVIEHDGRALVEELAEKFETSVETIRRDLSSLADDGRIRKVHGGAVKLSTSEESAFGERAKQNTLAKQLIAEKLAGLIKPGQSLLIDTGTTTLACAGALSRIKRLTVMTNSVRIADAILSNESDTKVILIGGTYKQDNAQTVGPTTINEIGQFRADHAILTVGTLDEEGACDFSEEEAQVARAMIKSAIQVTIVADCSKLERRSTYKVCDLAEIDRLVLDAEPKSDFQNSLRAANVEIL